MAAHRRQTDPLAAGNTTSEFQLALASAIVSVLVGAYASINPHWNGQLSPTARALLVGGVVAAITWIAHFYSAHRKAIKVAALKLLPDPQFIAKLIEDAVRSAPSAVTADVDNIIRQAISLLPDSIELQQLLQTQANNIISSFAAVKTSEPHAPDAIVVGGVTYHATPDATPVTPEPTPGG